MTFESIFRSCLEGILVVDSKGTILMVNPSCCKMFDYTQKEMAGMSVESLVPTNHAKKHVHHRKQYLKDPKPRQMGRGRDLVAVKKNGSEFPIEISLSSTKLDSQPVTIAFAIDISKRKQIEEAVKREKETAQLYLDVAATMFVVLDTKQRIVLVNQKACEILGYPEKQLIGRKWVENFIPAYQRKQVNKVFRQNIKGQGKFANQYENPIINKKGEERLIFWQNTLIKDVDGRISYSLSSGIDITERKAAEDAMRKSEEQLIIYASELEKRVNERTVELGQTVEKLRKLNEDLEKEVRIRLKAEQDVRDALSQQRELNALKSRFVSMASHEFRTPLSAILSSASLISKYKNADTEKKRSKHVTRIKASVSNMTNILNDFLSLGKLEEGKVSLNTSVFDLVALGRESVEETQLGAKRGQKIVMISNKDRQEVLLDRNLTKNILNNLLSNAVKYSAEDKDSKLSFNFKDKWITIKVTDQGMGIPIEDQKHIFERFFRAQNATYIQGTGLGLNLVKKYVGMMKGSISFKSELNVGTVFTAKLPYKV